MSAPPPPSYFMPLPYDTVDMPGGSQTQWRSGIPNSLDSLTLHPEKLFNIQHSHNSSDGEADTGFPSHAESRQAPAATTNVGRSTVVHPSNQRSFPDLVLDRPDQFEDTPYVPPRITQTEFQPYPALHPRANNVYDPPNYDISQLQYPSEGGTSPCESHQSLESNWSTSSSSSTSSQQLQHVESPLEYSHTPLPPRPTTNPHYPAYYGQHRLGLEHVRYGDHPSNAGGSYYRTTPQGYSVNSLLSHEIDDANTHVAISSRGTVQRSSSVSAVNPPPNINISTFSVSPTSITEGNPTRFPDAGPYLRKQLGLPSHDPVCLYSLPDPPPGEKPSVPLPILVKLAIYGSPNKQLTLQEIYAALEHRFQWFRDHKHERAWKNSIRHNLSLNKVFRNVPRPITEPGKGSYWRLDVSQGEGYKRPRKRRPKNKMAASEEDEEEGSELDEDRQSPFDFRHAGPSQSSALFSEDAHIDPDLRSEGHVVGEGRTRSTTRRIGGPYPSPSPREGPFPVLTGQDASALGRPSVTSGQPSFGQSSFPTYPQTRLMPAASSVSTSPFATLSSASVTMAPTTSMHPHIQHVASYDRPVPLSSSSRTGIDYAVDAGTPAARRVNTYPPSQGEPRYATRSPTAASSSSGSQAWNAARSTFTQDGL